MNRLTVWDEELGTFHYKDGVPVNYIDDWDLINYIGVLEENLVNGDIIRHGSPEEFLDSLYSLYSGLEKTRRSACRMPSKQQELLFSAIDREMAKRTNISESARHIIVARFVDSYDFSNTAANHISAGGWAQYLIAEYGL